MTRTMGLLFMCAASVFGAQVPHATQRIPPPIDQPPTPIPTPTPGPLGAKEIASCTTIDQPGMYVLGKTIVTSADCIVVAADLVTIDLGGFALIHTGDVGENIAIGDGGTGHFGITIRNGAIRGFRNGIDLSASQGVSVRDVALTEIGAPTKPGRAIITGAASTISDNRVQNNIMKTNIEVGRSSIVSRNIIADSSGIGIVAGPGSSVRENVISDVAEDGINMDENGNVQDNIVQNVNDLGINTRSHSTVIGNTVVGSDGSVGTGITAGTGSTVIGNTVRNFGMGMAVSKESLIAQNTAAGAVDIGIAVDGNAMVINNTIAANGEHGVQVTQPGTVVIGNHITGNKVHGVRCTVEKGATSGVKNNTFSGNGADIENCANLGGNSSGF